MRDAHIERTDVLYHFASGIKYVGDLLAGDAQRLVSDCGILMDELEAAVVRIQQRHDDAESEYNAIDSELSDYGDGPEGEEPEVVRRHQDELKERLAEARHIADERYEAYVEAQQLSNQGYSRLLTMQGEFNKFAGEIQSRSSKVGSHVNKIAALIDDAYKSKKL